MSMFSSKSAGKAGVYPFQRKLLKKGKAKHLNIFEAVYLRVVGRRDGKAGLPRQIPSGNWESPWLFKEVSDYQEFCDNAWGLTQEHLCEHYKKVGIIIDGIKRKEEALDQLIQNAPEGPEAEYLKTRKAGESDIPEDLILARRRSDFLRQNASYNNNIYAVKAELERAYIEFDGYQNHIIETNNDTRLICERVKNHTGQRRNAYWNAAIRVHIEKLKIPLQPSPLPEPEAEAIYMAQHRNLEGEAGELIGRKERLKLRPELERSVRYNREVA